MGMKAVTKNARVELLQAVKADRNQPLSEVLAVHLDEGMEGLLPGLELYEDAQFSCVEVHDPVADHSVETALLPNFFLEPLFQLL